MNSLFGDHGGWKEMNNTKLMAIAMLAVVGATANAQSIFNYNVNGGVYSQNFNTLNTSSSAAWSNNASFPFSGMTGWSAWRAGSAGISGSRDATSANNTAIVASDGNSNTGALYSFGSFGSSDRALGNVGSGGTGDFLFVLALKNTTGDTLTQFTLGYDMEQWRNGGNTSAQSMIFDYKDLNSASIAFTDTDANAAGFTTPGGAFDGASVVNTSTATTVNGNAAGLVSGRGGTITGLNWANGDVLLLRWWDDNNQGNDHGLSIDNVTFSAVPEPGTMVALGLGLAAMARRRRANKD